MPAPLAGQRWGKREREFLIRLRHLHLPPTPTMTNKHRTVVVSQFYGKRSVPFNRSKPRNDAKPRPQASEASSPHAHSFGPGLDHAYLAKPQRRLAKDLKLAPGDSTALRALTLIINKPNFDAGRIAGQAERRCLKSLTPWLAGPSSPCAGKRPPTRTFWSVVSLRDPVSVAPGAAAANTFELYPVALGDCQSPLVPLPPWRTSIFASTTYLQLGAVPRVLLQWRLGTPRL